MRVSPKWFDKVTILLMVCALAGAVFYQGCQKEAEMPAKEEKMTVKEEKMTVKEEKMTVKEEKMTVKEKVKEVNAVQVEQAKEATKEVAPAVAPSETKPAAVAKPTEAKPAAVAKPTEAKPAETSEGKDVAVTVNGKVITEAELDARLKPVLDRAAMRMDPNKIALYAKNIRGQALEGMIMERLLDEQVEKAGITVTEKDVNEKVNEILTQQGLTMDGFKQMLQMQGLTFEQFMQQIEKGVKYEKLMDKQVGRVDINDAEALAFYEENKVDFNTPEQVQASHILIKVASSATPEEKAAAKEKAEKLLKEIKEGADFATLARENSDCPSKAKGGDLGLFRRGQMVKEFEDVAFGLQPGQVSDVVETQFGYHIIKVTDRKEAGMTAFEKVKADIIKNLQQGKKNQQFRRYVQKLRAEANVVYPPGKEPAPARPMGPGGEGRVAPPAQ